MHRLSFLLIAILQGFVIKSQISGFVAIPTTYTSLATVINLLNTQGTSGPLTVAIAAGYTETAPAGGYSLFATGSVTSPIVFQKNGSGANPLITSFSGGNKTPGSTSQDGVWRLIGCDYIVINGIDLYDPSTTNPQSMEFGYGLFKLNSTNGCQHNIIKNCVITLTKQNNANGSGPASDGSRGIEVVNATASAHTSSLIINSVSGSNSDNKFYSNTIQNCNIGISVIGFSDVSPFAFADFGNDLGGNLPATGNTIVNFGGGGSANAAAAIKTASQYGLNISNNLVNNNTGSGVNHPGTLRGIYVNSATSANATINNNTLSISGGGTNSQVFVIDNSSGSSPASNSITINNNLIVNSNYSTAVSGSFYGILNSGSPTNLFVSNNRFTTNSTSATSGGTYLIYNSGAVGTLISITGNSLSFNYNGPASYSGTLYNIYNNGGSSTASLNITANNFSDYRYSNFQGTGSVYFIYNTADLFSLQVHSNRGNGLVMYHNGAEYFMYNSSSTQSVLSVCNNSLTNHLRTAASANIYGYYGAATSPGSAIHTFSGNLISNMSSNVQGSGNFYGIYDAEGGISPYPLKSIFNNTITNVSMSSTGQFYGIYCTDLGDGGLANNSEIYNNTISNISCSDNIYGLYASSPISPSMPIRVHDNYVANLNSSGSNSTAYAAYVGSNNAGLNCYRNKFCNVSASGTAAITYGLYTASSSTTSIFNNIIGNISTPFSGGPNRCNGIYISNGGNVNVMYNSVFLGGSSTGSNFGSNALYASSTASLYLRNNVLINTAIPTGTGITAAYRRSSSTVTTYSMLSNNNIFYAGIPSVSNLIFHNGTTGYQNLSAFQTALTPRESFSQTQNSSFLSIFGSSPNYLHMNPNVSNFAESAAVNIPGISDDCDLEIRQGNTSYLGSGIAPDVGADEFELNLSPCIGTSSNSISLLSAILCAGQSATIISSANSAGSGLVQQWRTSTVSGGPYFNVSGGVGAATAEYVTTALTAGTYYFVLQTTCASTSISAVSNEATLVVNPTPSVSASSSATLLCAGQNLNLIGSSNSGANYLWLGPSGFYSRQQNPSISSIGLMGSGVYSLQTELNNCNSALGTVPITLSDITLTLISTDPVVCAGNSSTLMAISSAVNFSWSTGATSNSIIVSPSINTTYSLAVTNTANCSIVKSTNISVINPTLTSIGALNCGPSGSSTLSVSTFSPSQVWWYSSAGSSVSIGSGTSYTLVPSSSTTLFVQAEANLPGNLLTSLSGNSPHQSTMFDIIATNAINVNGVDVHAAAAGINTIEVWYKQGTFAGFNLSNAGWTLAGTSTVMSSGANMISPVPLNFVLPLSAGQTLALYIASSGGSLNCTNSGTTGSVFSSNADFQLLTGNAGNYFNVINSSKAFNGVIRYSRAGCRSPLLPVTLTVSALPVIMATANPSMVCPGKSTTLSALGASSYSWITLSVGSTVAVMPAAVTTFTVIGANTYGCENTTTLQVGLYSSPTIVLTQTINSVCPSSPTTFTASGASTYTWNTGPNGPIVTVTPAINTTYTVYGSSAQGCISTNTIAVSTLSVPVVLITPSSSTFCAGERITFSATGAASYTWFPGKITSAIFNANPIVSSVYNAIGMSANGCTSTAFANVETQACSGLSAMAGESHGVKIFPNPSTGQIVLIYDREEVCKVVIMNSLGDLVFHRHIDGGRLDLNLADFPKGIYLISIESLVTKLVLY
ncbi:MAG: T9SS type A sorting domain-containing protein [bacterium]|nr:T9SS type A sorting domain-containing protein [bacterium]